MNIVFLGPPGAGKGTQAMRLCEREGVPHISTGDILRAAMLAGTPIGLEAKASIDRGELVSDQVVANLVRERLAMDDCESGFLLDGFPRTIRQAELLDNVLDGIGSHLDVVVLIDVPDDELVRRLRSRGQGRADDAPDVIENRLRVYAEQTEPLCEHYEEAGLLVHVDGVGDVDAITARVFRAVDDATDSQTPELDA